MKSVIVGGRYTYGNNDNGVIVKVVGADYGKRIVHYQREEYPKEITVTYKVEWEIFINTFEYIIEEQQKLTINE